MLSYKISPPRHAEKAYQPNQGDKFPTLSTVPTTIGPSQYLVVLLTIIFNSYPWGCAEVSDYIESLRRSDQVCRWYVPDVGGRAKRSALITRSFPHRPLAARHDAMQGAYQPAAVPRHGQGSHRRAQGEGAGFGGRGRRRARRFTCAPRGLSSSARLIAQETKSARARRRSQSVRRNGAAATKNP